MASSIGLDELGSVPEAFKEEDKSPNIKNAEDNKSIELPLDKAE